jgi:hypothetical protein
VLTQSFTSKNAQGTNGSTLKVDNYTLSDSNGGANYTVTKVNATGTITPATLAIKAATDSKTYDGTTHSSGVVTYTGLQTGDSLSGLSQAFADQNVKGTNGSNLNVLSGYTLTDGNGGGNYIVSTATAIGTINPAALTITGLSGSDRTYNGSTVDSLNGTATLAGLINGESLTLGNTTFGTLASANAGSEAVTTAITLADNGSFLASNYTLTQPMLANVTIAQAPLTVSGLYGTNRVYNGSTVDALTGTAVLSGLILGESLALNGTGSGTLDSANAGNRTISTALTLVNGTSLASNYSLTQPTLSNVTITQAPLTVTGLTGTGRNYNGSIVDALSGTAMLSGLVSGESLTLGGTASGTLDSANVGNRTVTTAITIADNGSFLAGNYTLTQPTLANVSITQAPLTVAGLSGTGRIYNGSTVDALTGSAALVGLVSGESLTLGGTSNGTLASANAGSEAITTAITIADNGSFLAGNYILTQPTLANVTIAQAPLTVTGLSATSRTYNASTVDALTGSASLIGLVSGESLTLGGTSNGTLASANAGSEAVTTAITIAANGSFLASNYTLTQPTLANVTIAQAPLTVSANNLSKTFGNADPVLTYSVSGLLSGDTANSSLTGTLSRTAGEASGVYAIQLGALGSTNYSLSYTPGTLKIVPLVLSGDSFIFPTAPTISHAPADATQMALNQTITRIVGAASMIPRIYTPHANTIWKTISIIDSGVLMPDDSLTP